MRVELLYVMFLLKVCCFLLMIDIGGFPPGCSRFLSLRGDDFRDERTTGRVGTVALPGGQHGGCAPRTGKMSRNLKQWRSTAATAKCWL